MHSIQANEDRKFTGVGREKKVRSNFHWPYLLWFLAFSHIPTTQSVETASDRDGCVNGTVTSAFQIGCIGAQATDIKADRKTRYGILEAHHMSLASGSKVTTENLTCCDRGSNLSEVATKPTQKVERDEPFASPMGINGTQRRKQNPKFDLKASIRKLLCKSGLYQLTPHRVQRKTTHLPQTKGSERSTESVTSTIDPVGWIHAIHAWIDLWLPEQPNMNGGN